jgi:hypothetical protein
MIGKAFPNSDVDLSIIIVSWNVRDLLRECLRSIENGRAALQIEVIVVDSASSDGSASTIATEFPWVTLLPQSANVGFPRGNNIGLSKAQGRNLLLLNPDTELIADALPRMVAYLDADPSIGALGPQLLNPDATVQSSRRRFPTLATGFFESTWLEGFAPWVVRRYRALDLPDNTLADVDWVIGACIMVPKIVYETVGGMDEAYFMYSEELDWCRRIKSNGWRVVYYPEAQVKHHYGKSSEQAITSRHINFQRAKLRYFRKYHGKLPASILRVFLLFSYTVQLAVEWVKGLLGHKPDLRRQRVRAYLDVIRSGLRPAGY